MRRLILLGVLLLLGLGGSWGCGKKGPPVPPSSQAAMLAGLAH